MRQYIALDEDGLVAKDVELDEQRRHNIQKIFYKGPQ